jgi:small glutamine-rich tetratricopeptide repeat-containing protein alpha
MGQFQEAFDAYTKGLELDPENKTMKQALLQAKKKLPEEGEAMATEDSPQVEDLESPFGARGAESGGMPDLGALGGMLNNPNFMNMAQQMLSQNPGLAQMAQQMMGGQGRGAGGAGGAPGNISDLLNNPALMNMYVRSLHILNFARIEGIRSMKLTNNSLLLGPSKQCQIRM